MAHVLLSIWLLLASSTSNAVCPYRFFNQIPIFSPLANVCKVLIFIVFSIAYFSRKFFFSTLVVICLSLLFFKHRHVGVNTLSKNVYRLLTRLLRFFRRTYRKFSLKLQFISYFRNDEQIEFVWIRMVNNFSITENSILTTQFDFFSANRSKIYVLHFKIVCVAEIKTKIERETNFFKIIHTQEKRFICWFLSFSRLAFLLLRLLCTFHTLINIK